MAGDGVISTYTQAARGGGLSLGIAAAVPVLLAISGVFAFRRQRRHAAV